MLRFKRDINLGVKILECKICLFSNMWIGKHYDIIYFAIILVSIIY